MKNKIWTKDRIHIFEPFIPKGHTAIQKHEKRKTAQPPDKCVTISCKQEPI